MGRLSAWLDDLEQQVDGARRWVGRRITPGGPPRIALYHSFGNASGARIVGRVVTDSREGPAGVGDGPLRNLVSAFRRFESDEVAGAEVQIAYGSALQQATSNGEGYIDTWVEAPPPDSGTGWLPMSAKVLDPPGISGVGRVLIPPASARFAVISDLDDTVIRTGATSLLRMATSTLLGNARTRLPFPGVAEFYRALTTGVLAEDGNPLCYVSSGPWNLHDFLVEFMEVRDIPVGPIQLRDWGTDREHLFTPGHLGHKLAAIDRIVTTWPTLPVILIGDSGQQDPEVYLEAARRYPGRILAIYIRDVSGPDRRASVLKLADPYHEAGTEMVLSGDTLAAARHAASRGWIAPEAVAAVEATA